MSVSVKIYFAHETHEKTRKFSEPKIERFLVSWKKPLVFKSRIMAEVYEQSQFAARRAKIVQHLGAMFIDQGGHRLDLYDNLLVVEKIR